MTIAVQPKTNTLSLEEFLEIPETKPASELIDGQIYQKPMPQGKHSTLQGRFTTIINQRGESEQLAFAFPVLRCTFAERSLVPDICVFEWANIPLDADGEILDKIELAPDWMIEILSPEQSSILVIDKISFALKHGTKLGWLIAPNEKTVLTFQGDRFNSHKDDDILPVLDVFHNWQLSVADLFDLLTFPTKK
ncbi:Uma2 family endonuclease [Tumidithrix elongata RA019]|uniref:Uma2 family endonuclease n=1 Tax=Tumidithrix elongata BACA0141 TaxID=2716417 RepID=A0AAW9Q0M1_9CYAN|nr:Uma2 family endonuclease [Tumidithrix elongata RA019]